MPCENTFDVKFYINGKEVDGVVELEEVPFIREEPEEDNDGKIAEILHDRYQAFIKAGFDKKQAFALIRDWFNKELEEVYVKKD